MRFSTEPHNADYLQFKKAFGSATGSNAYNAYNADFDADADADADADGIINNADYLQFKKCFLTSFTY